MASSVKHGENPASDPADKDLQTSTSAGAIEAQALALIHSANVTGNDLVQLARTPEALKSRKIVFALATHPRTPRHISLPLLRRIFTFDLMQVTLTPAVAADIKRAAEDQILVRLESLSIGERISLARRASGRVAAELLRDSDLRVVSAALDNNRLIEAGVVTALMKANAPEAVFVCVSSHAKWSQRREVQIALLRSEKTPLERAREYVGHFSPEFLSEIVPESRIAGLAPQRLEANSPEIPPPDTGETPRDKAQPDSPSPSTPPGRPPGT